MIQEEVNLLKEPSSRLKASAIMASSNGEAHPSQSLKEAGKQPDQREEGPGRHTFLLTFPLFHVHLPMWSCWLIAFFKGEAGEQ